ncbi:hypothetical protein ABPG72_021230 [Tetrahymena utriculariae]
MLSIDQPNLEEFIRVIVRKKPQIQTQNMNEVQVVINQRDNSIQVNNNSNETSEASTFYFDTIFDEKSTQQQIYDNAVSPLVNSLFQDINSTIWAFGQTRSGKSQTLFGNKCDEQNQGIVYRAIDQIFSQIKHLSDTKEEQKEINEEYKVYVSVYTLYREQLEDMLVDQRKDLRIRQNLDQIYIENLTKIQISNQQEFQDVLQNGIKKNLINITYRSLLQSKEYFFIEVSILKTNKILGIEQMSYLKIVEFQGCERSKKPLNQTQFSENSQINKGLTHFCQVISALTDEKSTHVPYRDSKITRIMQDALGGNSRGLMICNLNTQLEYHEILYNLRVASRVQQVRNHIFFNKKQSTDL